MSSILGKIKSRLAFLDKFAPLQQSAPSPQSLPVRPGNLALNTQDFSNMPINRDKALKTEKQFLGLIARCKDEYFVKEFCDYYLGQGFDQLFIIDDDSEDKSIYADIISKKVTVIYEKDIIRNKFVKKLYRTIGHLFEWILYVDVDEFVATKLNISRTIREELKTTFSQVDCVKIPWVMMSCNGKKGNPKSVLVENTFRWNHDKKHPHSIDKFRCRFDSIEVKCVFKPSKFKDISDHVPIANKVLRPPTVVDSITLARRGLRGFYPQLREEKIKTGYLLCYHYRIISIKALATQLMISMIPTIPS
jgi:hypothetical protein